MKDTDIGQFAKGSDVSITITRVDIMINLGTDFLLSVARGFKVNFVTDRSNVLQ